jgi:hypothetical protein
MNSLQSVVLALAVSYALIGALLLAILVYSRLPWRAKAVAVVVTSVFYIATFAGTRSLLGWATTERLPPNFKLLHSRIVDPHTVEGDQGSIYLWIEALDADNRPSGVPRAYRLPYTDRLAERTHEAERQMAIGHPQGGRAADFGNGEGGLIDAVREYIVPRAILSTEGGDPSTGEFKAGALPGDNVSFTPLLPPRMPPKDQDQ